MLYYILPLMRTGLHVYINYIYQIQRHLSYTELHIQGWMTVQTVGPSKDDAQGPSFGLSRVEQFQLWNSRSVDYKR